jgi:hypothetical protein
LPYGHLLQNMTKSTPSSKMWQASGIGSLQGEARALRARGVQTARGGEWTARQVANILERASGPFAAVAA